MTEIEKVKVSETITHHTTFVLTELWNQKGMHGHNEYEAMSQ